MIIKKIQIQRKNSELKRHESEKNKKDFEAKS